jgi:hypothetical protein
MRCALLFGCSRESGDLMKLFHQITFFDGQRKE